MNMKHELDPAPLMKSAHHEQALIAHDHDVTVKEEPTLLVAENAVALTPNANLFPAGDNGAVEEELAVEHTPNLAQQLTEFALAESHMPASLSAAVGDELAVEHVPYFAQQLETLEEEQRARQNERAEKEALKKTLREAEEEMNRLAKALEREKRETERQRLHYERRLKELEQRVAETRASSQADVASAEAEQENLASPKAAFRIDLYPHQGQYQGKIEHMLTHDKRAFSGLDHAAISAFIAAHLPQAETKGEELQRLAALEVQEAGKAETLSSLPQAETKTKASQRHTMLEAKEEGKLKAPAFLPEVETKVEVPPERTEQESNKTEAPAPGSAAPFVVETALRVCNMEAVLAGTRRRASMLPCDQAFDVEIEFEGLCLSKSECTAWICHATFFAKCVGAGAKLNLGEAAHRLSAQEQNFQLKIAGAQLPRGTYRLEALVYLNRETTNTPSLTLHAQKFILVY